MKGSKSIQVERAVTDAIRESLLKRYMMPVFITFAGLVLLLWGLFESYIVILVALSLMTLGVLFFISVFNLAYPAFRVSEAVERRLRRLGLLAETEDNRHALRALIRIAKQKDLRGEIVRKMLFEFPDVRELSLSLYSERKLDYLSWKSEVFPTSPYTGEELTELEDILLLNVPAMCDTFLLSPRGDYLINGYIEGQSVVLHLPEGANLRFPNLTTMVEFFGQVDYFPDFRAGELMLTHWTLFYIPAH